MITWGSADGKAWGSYAKFVRVSPQPLEVWDLSGKRSTQSGDSLIARGNLRQLAKTRESRLTDSRLFDRFRLELDLPLIDSIEVDLVTRSTGTASGPTHLNECRGGLLGEARGIAASVVAISATRNAKAKSTTASYFGLEVTVVFRMEASSLILYRGRKFVVDTADLCSSQLLAWDRWKAHSQSSSCVLARAS